MAAKHSCFLEEIKFITVIVIIIKLGPSEDASYVCGQKGRGTFQTRSAGST